MACQFQRLIANLNTLNQVCPKSGSGANHGPVIRFHSAAALCIIYGLC